MPDAYAKLQIPHDMENTAIKTDILILKENKTFTDYEISSFDHKVNW